MAAVILLTVATACVWTFPPIFWQLPTSILTEAAAAASIGLINSVVNLGGFVGPYLVGYFQDLTGSLAAGLAYLVASLLLAGVFVLRLHPVRPAAPSEPRPQGSGHKSSDK